MRNLGYVVNIADNVAEVVLGEHLDCKHCGACMAVLGQKQRKVRAANDIGARVGQKVEIEIAPSQAVLASFLIFILPLFVAFGGGFAGYYLARHLGISSEVGTVAFGGGFLAVSFLLLRHFQEAWFGGSAVRIVGFLSEEPPERGSSEKESSERGCQCLL